VPSQVNRVSVGRQNFEKSRGVNFHEEFGNGEIARVVCRRGGDDLCAGKRECGARQAAKPRLVTQAVDESNRVTMRGSVHPLARPDSIKARLRIRSR